MLAFLHRALRYVRAESLLLMLLGTFGLLQCVSTTPLGADFSLVEWPTIAALAGLLALTKGLELSGGLHWLGARLLTHLTSERQTALCLVCLAALLSMVLTNDVALFFVVPLTVGICRARKLPSARLVIFEALAVNAGSALTPVGNPQNLFLWQFARVPAALFIRQMLPLVVLMLMALLALTWWAFEGETTSASTVVPAPASGGAGAGWSTSASESEPIDRALLWASLLLYPSFLLAAELNEAAAAAPLVLLVLGVLRPRLLTELDWGLLLVFVLMFIDMRLLTTLPTIQALMQGADVAQPRHLLLAGIGLSQLTSNVPAAIALAAYSSNWQVLAYAVNVGGFGWMVGSLANLIALRLGGDRHAWIRFHAYSVPMLILSALFAFCLLSASGLLF